MSLSSLDFEDSDTYDTVALASTITVSHDNMSIAVWVKRENATGNVDTILGKSDLPHHHYLQVTSAGAINYKQYPNTLDTLGNHITDTNWHHIIVTLNGDTNGQIYVDGVARTLQYNQVTADGTFDQIGLRGDSGDGESTAQEMDGLIRDLKFYDYALSADQAASLYSGSYNVTPKYWYKLDEGTGNVSSSGTATNIAGTLSGPAWVNGTLDLDGSLTIAANGTLSAPRGNLDMGHDVDINGTYTHNNGTFHVTDGEGENFIDCNGASFYNFTSSSDVGRVRENLTVENILTIDSHSLAFVQYGNTTLTMGTSTSAGTITGSHYITPYSPALGDVVIQGVSNLFPCVVSSSTDWDWDYNDFTSTNSIELSNIDYQRALTTGGGTTYIKLTGDCEFDAVTVSSGDTLDINGKRAEFSGVLQNSGAIKSTGGGLIIADDNIKHSGSMEGMHDGDVNVIVNGGTAHDWRLGAADGGAPWCRHLLTNGTVQVTDDVGRTDGTQYFNPESIIVGSGTLTNTTDKHYVKDMTIATGGTFTPSHANVVVGLAGDFTTSGGLLGASCLSFPNQDRLVDLGAAFGPADGDDFTIEAWFKCPTSGHSGNQNYIVGKRNGGGNHTVAIFTNNTANVDKITANVNDGSNGFSIYSNSTVNDGKWHHVAFVYDASDKAKLYLDGKLQSEADCTGVGALDFSAITCIGARGTGTSSLTDADYHWIGEIDEVRIWEDVRTETEIRTNMFDETPAGDNLLRHYKLNEGTGSSAADTGSAGVAGTIKDSASAPSAATTDVWAGAGTFTQGTSTLKMTGAGTSLNYLSGEVLGHLLIDNSSGTVTASVLTGTNNLTVSSLKVNDSSASFTAPAGTLTITGKDASNYIIDLDGAFVHSDGTVKIDTSLTGDKLLDIIPSAGAGLYNLIVNEDGSGGAQFNGNSTIVHDLTIEEGVLAYYDSNNSELTVGGDVLIEAGGTLGAAGQTDAYEFGSLTIASGGTYVATSGTTTLTSETSGGYTWRNDGGTFTHNSGTVTTNSSVDTKIKENTFYNLILNQSSSGKFVYWEDTSGNTCTVANDLTITMGRLRGLVASDTVTVTGDVSVAADGTFNHSSVWTGAVNHGSLTIASGGTYSATSGTTTITGGNSGTGYSFQNSGTFTHNNGKVLFEFTATSNWYSQSNEYYDLELKLGNNNYFMFLTDQSGNAIKVLNNLTVSGGLLELYTVDDTFDVYGNTLVTGGIMHANSDQNTNTITHHGVVTMTGGEIRLNDGTTTKMGGFRKLGGTLTVS